MAAPCRMRCVVTFGEASQPSSLPSLCIFVFEILFSSPAFLPLCLSTNSPLLHCLGSHRFTIESEKSHGAL